MKLLAVDPGHKFGCVAWPEASTSGHAGMPGHINTVSTQDLRAKRLSFSTLFSKVLPDVIVVEKIPPIDSPGCFKLAMSYGQVVEAAEASTASVVIYVEPQVWQHHFKISPWLKYDERKRHCQGLAKEIYGVDKIRLHDSDALLILKWALDTITNLKP